VNKAVNSVELGAAYDVSDITAHGLSPIGEGSERARAPSIVGRRDARDVARSSTGNLDRRPRSVVKRFREN
jgi:hypothetical protein